MWYANSGNSSELVTSLPMIPSSTKKVIYSIALPNLSTGDLIEAFSTFEATNPKTFNVMVGRQLIVADSSVAISGTEFSEGSARNITPGMHHDHIEDFGSLIVPNDWSGKFVNVIAWSGASAAAAGDMTIIEQDYGRLFVNIYRVTELE